MGKILPKRVYTKPVLRNTVHYAYFLTLHSYASSFEAGRTKISLILTFVTHIFHTACFCRCQGAAFILTYNVTATSTAFSYGSTRLWLVKNTWSHLVPPIEGCSLISYLNFPVKSEQLCGSPNSFI